MKQTKNRLNACLLAAASAMLLSTSAEAALVISDGDIDQVNDTYSYSLNQGNLTTKFFTDVSSSSNLQAEGTPSIAPINGVTSASLIYAFDFTTTSYRPTSLNLTERLTMFNQNYGSGATNPNASIISSYSLDGTTWVSLNSLTSAGTAPQPGFVNWYTGDSFTTTSSIDLSSQPSVVYYKVDFSTTEFGGYPNGNQNQWSRADVSGATFTPFIADFGVTAVPEPSAVMLAAIGGVIFATVRRSQRKSA